LWEHRKENDGNGIVFEQHFGVIRRGRDDVLPQGYIIVHLYIAGEREERYHRNRAYGLFQ
jgi:hypothetical protein